MPKEFEIDVSGEDIFCHNYTVVVADKNNGIIKGYKFNGDLIQILKSRRGEGKYRYPLSKEGNALFKIRLYCIIIYYLFRDIDFRDMDHEIKLEICRDFQGHEQNITSNLKSFLEENLHLKISTKYVKLPKDSNADKYAYLMRKDTSNKIKGYVKIELEDMEKYLKRK